MINSKPYLFNRTFNFFDLFCGILSLILFIILMNILNIQGYYGEKLNIKVSRGDILCICIYFLFILLFLTKIKNKPKMNIKKKDNISLGVSPFYIPILNQKK